MRFRPLLRPAVRRGRNRRLSARILKGQLVILALTGIVGFVLLAFSQRAQLDRWASLVHEASRAHGGTPPDEVTARLRVHAALSVVLDGGWGTGFDPAATARLGELARTLLLPR